MAISYFTNLLAMVRKPFYGAVPLFPSDQDLSWIPDAGSNVPTAFPTQSPDGSRVAFLFTLTPKYLVWNGQLLRPPQDFTVSGQTATMPIAPRTGDELYAVV